MYLRDNLEVVLEDRATARKVEPAPFSLESLIAWLETKDPAGEYDYCRPHACLLAKYVFESGGHIDGSAAEYVLGEARMTVFGGKHPPHIEEVIRGAWRENSRTFGAALTRAQLALERAQA